MWLSKGRLHFEFAGGKKIVVFVRYEYTTNYFSLYITIDYIEKKYSFCMRCCLFHAFNILQEK